MYSIPPRGICYDPIFTRTGPNARKATFSMSTQTSTYNVSGMTCSHCVLSVKEEISELDGVESVEVDLASGRVEVAGVGVTDDQVRAAVAEAGYEVVA